MLAHERRFNRVLRVFQACEARQLLALSFERGGSSKLSRNMLCFQRYISHEVQLQVCPRSGAFEHRSYILYIVVAVSTADAAIGCFGA